MDAPPYRLPPPIGPFVEVPYRIFRYWVGVPLADVVEAQGFPPAVRQFLLPEEIDQRSVSGWESYAAYVAANGVDQCPTGRAWLEADERAKLRYHSGAWYRPRRTPRGRFKW
jgi:hypothetical protein